MTNPINLSSMCLPKAFVSYSHDSPEHKSRVLELADRLISEGIEVALDRYVLGTPAEGWPRWMQNQIEIADFVLVVCTETYYERFRGKGPTGVGKGVDWEGAIITNELYKNKSCHNKYIPIVFLDADQEWIPESLRSHTCYNLGAANRYEMLYRHLTQQPEVIRPPLGQIHKLPVKQPTAIPLSAGDDPKIATGPRTEKENSGSQRGVEITIALGLKDFNPQYQQLLKHGLGSFLSIPAENVRILSIRPGSVRVILGLPSNKAEGLCLAFETSRDELLKSVAPIEILAIRAVFPILQKELSSAPKPKIGSSLNPILVLDHVIDEYRDYLRSEFRARDKTLREALETELDRPLFLAQEPFYQAHRPFRHGEPWSRLPIDPALARAMAERARRETAFLHQSESINHLLGSNPSPLVVTTGTGSGKTECFLLPVIQNAIDDARQFRRTGLTAILIYPMNALANDQEKRIGELLEAAGVTDEIDVRKYDRGTSQTERERMRNNPPRILLTNYMMLEYLLIRPKDQDDLFANHRCRFLVLDEVHTYRGVLGSNIALLLRRLKAHLAHARQDWSPDVSAEQHAARYPALLNVGTSATIKSMADPGLSADERRQRRDASVQDFFSRLTGDPPHTIRVIGEVLEDIAVPAEARMAPTVPALPPVDVTSAASVEHALVASAGITPTGDLAAAARHARLLWLLNQWLVAQPMSVSQIVQRLMTEAPERRNSPNDAVRGEVEAVLLAGSALPDGIPGGLRLHAHRLLRGG